MSFENFDPVDCDLCGSSRSTVLLSVPARSFTSDSRVVELPLKKLVCSECLLIRNGMVFSQEFLEMHYNIEYSLGIQAARSEPVFFTPEGRIPRSRMVFEWMKQGLERAGIALESLKDVVEIGCGEGSLLRHFSAACRDGSARGLEMNTASVQLARAHGLEVAQGTYSTLSGAHDLIYSFAVIEHVPSPSHYISFLKSHLRPDGYLLVAQPCQDNGNIDVFFCDHLHHFRSDHVRAYARKHGLYELYAANSHPYIRNFSMHVLARRARPNAHMDLIRHEADSRAKVEYWLFLFESVDAWLVEHVNKKLVVWGIGQMFMLLCAYTRLSPSSVALAIDDNIERFRGTDLPFPVITSEEVESRLDTDHAVLFTFSPRDEQKAFLRDLRLEFHSVAF
jgi:SAM-dependent methyltransferase